MDKEPDKTSTTIIADKASTIDGGNKEGKDKDAEILARLGYKQGVLPCGYEPNL